MVRSGWLFALLSVCEEEGASVSRLLEGTNLTREMLAEENGRVGIEAFRKVWRRVEHFYNQPELGVKVGQRMHLAMFGALSFLFISSSSLEEALRGLQKYSVLFSHMARFEVVERDSNVDFEVNILGAPDIPLEFALTSFIAAIVEWVRLLCKDTRGLQRIELTFDLPANKEPYQSYFGCPVVFGAKRNRLVFSAAFAKRRLFTGRPELGRVLEQQLMDEMSRFQRVDMTGQVYAKLCELLPRGQASQKRIAGLLNVSVRKLQMQLLQEETTYKDLFDQVRQSLVMNFIKDRRLTVSEIGCRIGFVNTSNFCRTFRRWYGMSPSEYRRQLVAA